jgi:DNA polymerase V
MKQQENCIHSEEIATIYSAGNYTQVLVPFLEGKVSAGFPSSAENFIDKSLDLNDLIIKHQAATFFIRVKGNSMTEAGIHSNDILVVDRSLAIANNHIIIARINDELTVKRIKIEGEKLFLVPANDEYKPIEITDDMDFEVWGTVTFVIHQTI